MVSVYEEGLLDKTAPIVHRKWQTSLIPDGGFR